MADSLEQFYDRLADEYHLLFRDWRSSVRRQGDTLDKIIRGRTGSPVLSVLDCSCGIGTQAIGLALHGYRVHGSDISAAAIARAKREAESFGVTMSFSCADVRKLQEQVKGIFDAVISCDNSLPHLLTDDDLHTALKNIRGKLKPGALFLASIRDYDEMIITRTWFTPPKIRDDANGRRITFQVWDWKDNGQTYTFHLFLMRKIQEEWKITEYSSEYRVLLRSQLNKILSETGFTGILWQMPSESGYYQPIVTAINPG